MTNMFFINMLHIDYIHIHNISIIMNYKNSLTGKTI